jgi:hypothetical protein
VLGGLGVSTGHSVPGAVPACSAVPPDPDAAHFDPAWRTSTVVAIVKGIAADGTFDAMPILADALQDAGCDNADLLDHCRHATGHTKGCWVLSQVLGTPLASELVHTPTLPLNNLQVFWQPAEMMGENEQAVSCTLGFLPIAILALSPLVAAGVSAFGRPMVFSVCCIPTTPFVLFYLVLCYRVVRNRRGMHRSG